MSEQDDWAIVQRCLQGDGKAFEELVEKYQKPLFNIALRMLHDEQDAEDVTQNAFLHAFENLQHYKPEHHFFSWIYRMTVNESINWIKKKKRRVPMDAAMADSSRLPDALAEREEISELVGRALMRLKPEARALIVLRHFHGTSYAELAYIFEIPQKTVKSRLFSARQQLREILRKQGLLKND